MTLLDMLPFSLIAFQLPLGQADITLKFPAGLFQLAGRDALPPDWSQLQLPPAESIRREVCVGHAKTEKEYCDDSACLQSWHVQKLATIRLHRRIAELETSLHNLQKSDPKNWGQLANKRFY